MDRKLDKNELMQGKIVGPVKGEGSRKYYTEGGSENKNLIIVIRSRCVSVLLFLLIVNILL